jgi:tripartite-type tricarboxylate transporter receptor subunit TctC
MELIYSLEVFGRPYMMPPGVPTERAAALRQAFMQTMADPELKAEAARAGLEIDPIDGAALQTLAQQLHATPAPLIERTKQALIYKAP